MAITVERLVAEIEADPAKAIASLKAFEAATASAAKDRKARIEVDVDQDSARQAERAFDRLAASADRGGGAARNSGRAAAFAVGGWRTLAFTLNGVNIAKFYGIAVLVPGALSSIAAAAGGAAASLALLGGVVGPLTAGLGALGLGIGATIMGMGGLADAYSAITAPTTSAAAATDRLTGRNYALIHATEALREARERLARAPYDAREAIEDAQFSYEGSLISRRRALLGLVDAQRTLNNLNKESAKSTYTLTQETDYFTGKVYEVARVSASEAKKSAVDEAQAKLDVRAAELALLEARDAVGDSARTLHELEAKGIRNSDIVVDARRAVRDAEWALADARRANTQALMGETAATIAARDAMAALTPAGRQFVLFLKNEFMPAWKTLRDAAQEGLLPGVENGLRSFMEMFPMLRPHIKAFSSTVGDAFAEFFGYWAQAGNQKDLSTMFTRLNRVLKSMLKVTVPLSDVMVQFTTAAAPFANRILTGLANKLENLADWMETVEGKKGMTEFFRLGNKFGGLWGDVLWELSGALKGVVKAAEPLATWMLKSLTGYFEDLSDSVNGIDGQNKLKDWFNDQKPAIREFTGLLKDLAGVFFTSGQGGEDSGFVRTMKHMRKNLVPAIGDLLETLDKSNFGPVFSEFITNIVDGVTWIVDHEGPILQFVELLNNIADGIRWMDKQTGGVSTNILGGLVMALGGLSILRRVGRWMRALFFPITWMIKKLPVLKRIVTGTPRTPRGGVGTGTAKPTTKTPTGPGKHRAPKTGRIPKVSAPTTGGGGGGAASKVLKGIPKIVTHPAAWLLGSEGSQSPQIGEFNKINYYIEPLKQFMTDSKNWDPFKNWVGSLQGLDRNLANVAGHKPHKVFGMLSDAAKRAGISVEDLGAYLPRTVDALNAAREGAKTGTAALEDLLVPALNETKNSARLSGREAKLAGDSYLGLGTSTRVAGDNANKARPKIRETGSATQTAGGRAKLAGDRFNFLGDQIGRIPRRVNIQVQASGLSTTLRELEEIRRAANKAGVRVAEVNSVGGITVGEPGGQVDGDWGGGRLTRGITMVGESGPELVRMGGTGGAIHSASETRSLLAGASSTSSGVSQAQFERLIRAIEEARPINIDQTFNEKVDPMHVSRELAWRLS